MAILTKGDIAFNSFNADEDGWSIVSFVDIDPGTIVYFTDNEATSPTAFNTGESYFQWNSGTAIIPAGTVIRFSGIDGAARAASIGTFSQATVAGSSNAGLSTTADTLYAYLGTSAAAPTTFLAGISNDATAQGTTDLTAAGLTVGVDAVLLTSSADYGVYNGPRSGQSSFASYKPLVNTVSNWTVDMTNGDYAATVPNTTSLAIAPPTPSAFTLELLHFSDQEAGIPALDDAPRLSAVLNALRNQDLNNDGLVDNTLVLSSGDAYIPGAFLNASTQAFGGQGRADILIQNELGVQAIAFGNHEFDLGTALVASLLKPAPATGTFPAYAGAAFPYLSGNLNFAPDSQLAPLVTADGQAASAIPGKIAASTIITVNGEKIGVVGATTPTLGTISSPGSVGISPLPFGGTPTAAELDALAAVIQADVDALLAANPDLNKVVLLAHMQQINIEKELATRLRNVDIIMAGGSNTRLVDANDPLRAGDTSQGVYPFFTTDREGKAIAVVNTDGNYKYVGRLVIDFDANGNILPNSYNAAVSGAYATDAAGVAALNAQALVDPEIQAIVDQLKGVVAAQDGAIFGHTDVFLNGGRSDVRTQETNFGNLSADANLAIARSVEPTTLISIKNGGGIRDNIGFVTFPPGSTNPADAVKSPPAANPLANKNEGDISQLDITNALRFNNGLTLVTLTATQLLQVIEHGVAATATGATPGQFPQIGGIKFSFDPSRPANDRVLTLSIVDNSGSVIQDVVRNGEVVGDPDRTFRVMTLNFLASGGDGYPFPAFLAANPTRFNRVDLLGEPDTNGNGILETTEDLNGNGLRDAAIADPGGVANFAQFGSEQDALAEYLAQNFPNPTRPYTAADTSPALDQRIQNVVFQPALPNVNLSVSTSAGSEANTTAITITATASSAVVGNQTVSLGVTGSGITASDYFLTSNSITIANGQTTGSVTLIVADDAIAEATETATLTLATPSAGITLGNITSRDITITNNSASTLQKVGGFTSPNGAEIPAFDPGSDRLFVVAGSTVEIYTVGSNGALTAAGSLSPGFVAPPGTQAIPNSVATKNGIVAVAYAVQNTSTGAQQVGQVSFYDAATGAVLNSVPVGFLPDMLTFTPDGQRVLVANEGEPNSYGQATSFDPEGSISIINLAAGVANASVTPVSFTSFNGQIAALRAAGVRITGPGSTVAQDLEPEYIAVSPDGTTARVTLQENNAIAILDIATATITSIQSLGLKNHSLPGNGLDPSDQDGGLNIRNVPVFGLYQPDAIASFTANGQTYYITANEGDSRSYPGFNEEVRVGSSSYVLDPTAFPNAAALKANSNLGRLQVTNATGDTDGDGDFDRIEVYGGRSFSIWDASGSQVFDSGSQLEQITATNTPTLFNSDGTAASFDSRSDNKGPEPEGVVVGVIGNRTYAFIGLERTGDVVVYEVTNPNSPQFVQYINIPEDVGTEGLTFIAAVDSPTGKPLLVTANEISKTVAVFEVTPPLRISDIQGAGHQSPYRGQTVSNIAGIVTAVAARGFYMQDPNPDASDATSEAIFVFTSSAPTVAVGDSIRVNGTVTEFRPGNNSNNLTTTQITSPSITLLSSGNPLPTAIILGNGGRALPTQIIDNDTSGNLETGTTTFDPAQDGIDFYESLEGMRVQINNPRATSPTNSFGELWVQADGGSNATGTTGRGGSLISASDFNPERIQIDDTLLTGGNVQVNVGDRLSTIVGVVDYNFSNYEVLPTSAPTVVTPTPLQKEVTNLIGTTSQLTVATFNVENLDPGDGAAQFNALASAIVNNLRSPDIINLEEIQDNNGATNDGVVDASVTYQTLIAAIAAAGGPTYEYRQIDPVNNQDGGEPGGNIRVGFLFNPNRVSFVEGSLQRLTDPNPSEVDAFAGDDFANSRKPLVGKFVFNGQEVTIIGNHFNSKGGDQPLFGPNQPPTRSSENQRSQQATIIRDYVQGLLAANPNANVIVAGDLNDFEFSNPLTILKGAGLSALIETLPANERYTYNFEGNAQALDHILASGNLRSQLDGLDVVHINSEFANQISDHDPLVARFTLPNIAPVALQDTAATNEDVAVNINVLANDTDTPGDRLQIVAVTTPSQGSAVINNNGTPNDFADDFITYTPNANSNGSDRFTYTIRDRAGSSATASVTVAIAPVNDAPLAVTDSVTTTAQRSVSFNVLANDSDPDAGDRIRLTGLNFGGIQGTVALGATSITYNPGTAFRSLGLGESAVETLTYAIADTQGASSTGTINITVTGLNDAPVLNPSVVQQLPAILEDPTTNSGVSVLSFAGSAITDPDATGLKGIAVRQTTGQGTWQYFTGGSWTNFGTVSGTAALLLSAETLVRFNPTANFNGTASLNYRAWDQTTGTLGSKVNTSSNGGATAFSSALATSSVTVQAVNDAPVNMLPTSASVTQGFTLTFAGANRIAVSDVDAGTAPIQVSLGVDRGSLSLSRVTGLSFSTGDGTNDASMTFTGSLTAINSALFGLRYTPDFAAVFQGSATLTLTSNDQGASGLAIPQTSDTDTLAIAVRPGRQVTGTPDNNTLVGSMGSDWISGLDGNDTLFGLAGVQDILWGGAGSDAIYVGSGNAYIDGGLGNDTIYLGGGQATVALASGNGTDTIQGFSAGSTRFNLTGGLTYSNLGISQAGQNTLITAGAETLAALVGVQASQLTATHFLSF
jgi:uncharacterized protein